ncbi:hypothetical protein [Halomonas sp. LBP4]|uniref:hypothetical protein n=1 Tax=Halomonas sp. LBP4 TaxID=2044917 RepID=UPI000D772703|nr:hypothetical protein [Halomonas sp. LBP4]PXX95847.1 hypothetical protein CR157_16745 [Halomonas sp. LBP4]
MSAFTPAPILVHGALTPFPIMCLTVGAATLLEVVDQYDVLDNLFGPSEGLVVDFVASGEDEASELAELVGYPGAPSDLQGHWLVLECAMPRCETELETLAYASAIAPFASFESNGRVTDPRQAIELFETGIKGLRTRVKAEMLSGAIGEAERTYAVMQQVLGLAEDALKAESRDGSHCAQHGSLSERLEAFLVERHSKAA